MPITTHDPRPDRPDRLPPIVVSYDEILADLLYPVAPDRVR